MAASADVEGLVAYTDRDTADAGGVRVLRASTLGEEGLAGTFPFIYRRPNDPEIFETVGVITGVSLVPPSYEGGIGSVQVVGDVDLEKLSFMGGAALTAQLQSGGAVDVSLAVLNPEITEEDGKQIIGGPWTVQHVMIDDGSPWPGCSIRATTVTISTETAT